MDRNLGWCPNGEKPMGQRINLDKPRMTVQYEKRKEQTIDLDRS